MNTTPDQELGRPELIIAILALVIAAVVQVIVTTGPYNFWNIMIAILLGGVLSMCPLTRKRYLVPLASTWGFVLVMGTGILLQAWYNHRIRPHTDLDNWLRKLSTPPESEAPSAFYFAAWLVYSLLALLILAIWLSRRQKRLKESSEPQANAPSEKGEIVGSPKVLQANPQGPVKNEPSAALTSEKKN